MVLANRDVPTGMLVEEVIGFRRFESTDYTDEMPAIALRCENYLSGGYRRDDETWPHFSLTKLLQDEQFLRAGEEMEA